MSRKSSKDTLDKLKKAVEGEIVFIPSGAQRKAKAAFWVSFTDNPVSDAENVTLAQALQITGESRLQKWWSMVGFKDWFLNKEENKQRLEYIYSLALDSAEEILIDPDANPSAKVQMIKVIAELANKMPQKWKTEKFLDADIQRMDKHQLESYLEKQGVKLLKSSGGDQE